ncbi:MAG: hypothetical protein KGN76_09140, partial [Acidobacteriota bacterium]|nr:hypothetical protein [Acidobacteriota bacterium]
AVTLPAHHGGLVPTLEFGAGDRWRQAAMNAPAGTGDGGRFVLRFPSVTSAFNYRVVAGGVSSPAYRVTVLHPPHVARIDLRYEYPAGLGLPPRTDPDSGDIYAPPGTRVRLHVVTDEPVTSGTITRDGAAPVALAAASPTALDGEIDVQEDDSYRVALADADGMKNAGDTEYFIRILAHRPPDVRIVRPARDRQVTPLEEVDIDAHADAEYGIRSFDLVYSLRGGPEHVAPFKTRRADGGGTDGRYEIALEDLQVKPGDLVSYYARAHDATRSGAAGEARSDIFFLEVQPFEETFTAAQSQTQALAGGQNRSIDDLVAAQKDIVVATWKLDRRSRAAERQSEQDVRSVGQAQGALKTRVEEQIGEFRGAMLRDPRKPASADDSDAATAAEAMTKAAEAMGKATASLNAVKTAAALPDEMEALNQLLKAQADVRERQVSQQASGGGRGDFRRNLDLSTLFDRELQRLQQTNYETPPSSQEQKPTAGDRALDRIRDLARRQDELQRQQQDLAKRQAQMRPEELKRQLERLTRDQSELRQQAEDLARQLEQQEAQRQASSQGQSSGSRSAAGQMQSASRAMGQATGQLRRDNLEQASRQAGDAASQLQQLARQLEDSGPREADPMGRALGDLRLQTRELADAERQMASQLSRLGQGGQAKGGAQARDALRRLAGVKQRLADRTRQVEQGLRQLMKQGASGPGAGATRDQPREQALAAAADELARQRVVARMRESAGEMQQAAADPKKPIDPAARVAAEQQLAQALDKVSNALADAGATGSAEARKLADQLARVQQLRDRLDAVQRQMDQLAGRAGGPQAARPPATGDRPSSSAAPGRQGREGGGEGGTTPADEMGRLRQLRDELMQSLQQARQLADGERDAPQAGLGFTPEGQEMVLSAPGTEAFKQDFARWGSLRRNATAALERLETSLSQKLQAQVSKDRLAAGGDDRVPARYQSLVDSYFKALADRKKPH